ncbi:DUF1203 domain-containing protein [Pseudonocardia xinjiangensis]|uniref:DUF1203 domain-containing protein n=1 Tax=Pseudonocardia xinjiangensis TaxID=75289 RepID=A0ABX1R6K6_9PSEU|nr:DUF1203 domain-containing protein [Pseudonocardia xinjiangensis]NMH76033.1 DUF1203 domain-containing protein [Pseudonocardia xinjiangensis]
MTTTTTAFRIHTVPDEVLHSARNSGADAFGTPVEHVTAEGDEPLRCCLRDARPGEEMILFGYEPPIPSSPYREIGAVLAHAEPCAGPDSLERYPPDWYGRPQVLRAYDHRGWIHAATTDHDGRHPEALIAALLAEPGVAQIHSRNRNWGCWMFTITRAE